MSSRLRFAHEHLINNEKRTCLGVTQTSRVGWLPQEIVDYIVGKVSHRRRTLIACTQVSRTWWIAARAHLYRTFTVSDPAGFEADINELKNMGITNLVRRVVVRWAYDNGEFIFGTPELTPLKAITHIQELDLRRLDINELVLTLRHEHFDTLKSTVRTLVLSRPTSSTKHILWFISLFSHLEDLSVLGLDMLDNDDTQVPAIESPPSLTGRLVLKSITHQSEFIHGLASMQNGFRTVELQSCKEVRGIIESCAETVERLIWQSDSPLGVYNLISSDCVP